MSLSDLSQRCVSFVEAAVSEVVTAKNQFNVSSFAPPLPFAPSPTTQATQPTHPMLEFRHLSLSATVRQRVQRSYSQWTRRMRVPPRVTRHELDADYPELQLPEDKCDGNINNMSRGREIALFLSGHGEKEQRERSHPAGPMIDWSLATFLSASKFEQSVLRHFVVYDARLPQHRERDEEKEEDNNGEEGDYEGDEGDEYDDAE